MPTIKYSLLAFVASLAFAVSAQAQTYQNEVPDDHKWEYREMVVYDDIEHTVFSIPYFRADSLDNDNDPDLGQDSLTIPYVAGFIRLHSVDMSYFIAACFFDHTETGELYTHETAPGVFVQRPSYVLRAYANGCNAELDTDMHVRLYCHGEAPVSRNRYRYKHPLKRKGRRVDLAIASAE